MENMEGDTNNDEFYGYNIINKIGGNSDSTDNSSPT